MCHSFWYRTINATVFIFILFISNAWIEFFNDPAHWFDLLILPFRWQYIQMHLIWWLTSSDFHFEWLHVFSSKMPTAWIDSSSFDRFWLLKWSLLFKKCWHKLGKTKNTWSKCLRKIILFVFVRFKCLFLLSNVCFIHIAWLHTVFAICLANEKKR